MRWPLMTKSRHENELGAALHDLKEQRAATGRAQNEAAQWQVQYRMIRGRIVDIATHPEATPQIRATLAEFARFRP